MLRNAARQDDHQVAWKRMKTGLPWAMRSVEEIRWSWESVRVKSGARSPTRVPAAGADGCVGARVDGAAAGGAAGVGAGSDPTPQARAMRRESAAAVDMIHRMFGCFIGGTPARVLLCGRLLCAVGEGLEDVRPARWVALSVAGTVGDDAVCVDGDFSGLAGYPEVPQHVADWERKDARVSALVLVVCEFAEGFVISDDVEVYRVLERWIDVGHAPQRGAAGWSPGCVEEDEDWLALGDEFGGGDSLVLGEC